MRFMRLFGEFLFYEISLTTSHRIVQASFILLRARAEQLVAVGLRARIARARPNLLALGKRAGPFEIGARTIGFARAGIHILVAHARLRHAARGASVHLGRRAAKAIVEGLLVGLAGERRNNLRHGAGEARFVRHPAIDHGLEFVVAGRGRVKTASAFALAVGPRLAAHARQIAAEVVAFAHKRVRAAAVGHNSHPAHPAHSARGHPAHSACSGCPARASLSAAARLGVIAAGREA